MIIQVFYKAIGILVLLRYFARTEEDKLYLMLRPEYLPSSRKTDKKISIRNVGNFTILIFNLVMV